MLSFRYTSDAYKQKQTMLLQIITFNAVTIYWYCNMPFNYKDKTLIKNAYQFKKYSFQRISTACLKINCKRRKWAC